MNAEPGPGDWRRLSTRMLLVHPVQELLRAWPVLVGLVVAGSAGGHGSWWSLAATAAVILGGLLRWFTTSYRVTAEQVQVRKGLLRRQVLTVPRDRIRTVDVTAHALHRSLGLAKVEVGTGRTDRKNDGVKLDALHTAEAARLRDELLHRVAASATRPAERPRETLLARMRPEWVRYGPFTLTGFVTVGVVAGVVWRSLNEAHVDPRRIRALSALLDRFGRTSPAVDVLIVAVALLVVVAAASTLGYVLAFHGFRLTRGDAGTLHVTRGLITTRAITIEERRLRGVEFSEPLLLRAVGGARCIAITTGLRVGRGAERGGSLLLPPAPRAEALRVAGAVLRDDVPFSRTPTGHGPRATRRRFSRAVGVALLVVAAAAALWALGAVPAWTWQVAFVLVPLAALVAADRARALGHTVVNGALVSSRGSLVRRRSVLSCEGIIGWNLRRSFFQRRSGLATLVATTAAGRQRVEVQDVPLPQALRIAEEALPGLLTPFLER
ncbi:PH domain-containing protein [Actinoallomurus rhizosphaericola]|uniref:PH domain-containing protein n=1 Tax=Actinoallomurus rhizosphaericola TaxID=2952536 RepID=UPI002091FFB2|nr:PH domain-containing protein [Actinoallomurus rhizosphaericola]MCO5996396.1 PH domain-containing protein [Actinoallomurus rhizosphaericola]